MAVRRNCSLGQPRRAAGGRGALLGDAREHPLVLRERALESESPGGDFVRVELGAMSAPAHLHHREDLLESPLHLGVAQEDDVLGQERDTVRAELDFIEGLAHLHRQQHADPTSREPPHHPVQRLAEVLPLARGERELEAVERVDDEAPRSQPGDRPLHLLEDFLGGEVEGVELKQLELPAPEHFTERDAEALRPLDVLLGSLLENGEHPRLARLHSLRDELRAEEGLVRPGRAGDQRQVPRGEAAPEKSVQVGHTHLRPPPTGGRPLAPSRRQRARGKTWTPSGPMRKV